MTKNVIIDICEDAAAEQRSIAKYKNIATLSRSISNVTAAEATRRKGKAEPEDTISSVSEKSDIRVLVWRMPKTN